MTDPARGSPPRVVVDAGVVLAWYLPAESFKDEALGLLEQAAADGVSLSVPSLTRYEIVNVLALAVRGVRARLTSDEALEILAAIQRAPVVEHSVIGLEDRMLQIATTFQRSAYDAAYLALMESLGAEFVTADATLYRAVHRHFSRIRLIEAHRGRHSRSF